LKWLLVIAVVALSALGSGGIAGGADSYGYISQADLWLKGDLHVAQPEAKRFPWPFGALSLAPLGYVPTRSGDAIVPVYAPGLPLILAAAKGLGGQCTIRWVGPISAGLLILITCAIGSRVFSERVGIAAAWLAATSPIVPFMGRSTMSDLPVAVLWGVATYCVLSRSWRGTAAGGLAAAAAILVRPNLAHLVVIIAAWLAFERGSALSSRLTRVLAFCAPAGMGVIAVALINQNLYGSPTSSGYGDLSSIFSPYRVLDNLQRYAAWLVQTQTPLAIIGILGFLVPARYITRDGAPPRGRLLLALTCFAVIGAYLLWLVFDAWWYLRFILPCWPAMCVSAAWLLTGGTGQRFTKPAIAILAAVGLYGLSFSYRAGVFDTGDGEYRYVRVAQLVRGATPPNAIIFAMQHSGSVRYYGERMTFRHDILGPGWLDLSTAWFQERGMRPFILLDDWEIEGFQRKFAKSNVAGRLEMATVFEYRGNPRVYLFDPLQPPRPGERPLVFEPDDVSVPTCPKPGLSPRMQLIH
jgi:hypothetical protein